MNIVNQEMENGHDEDFRFNLKDGEDWKTNRARTGLWAKCYWKRIKLPLVTDIGADKLWKGIVREERETGIGHKEEQYEGDELGDWSVSLWRKPSK